MGGRRDLKILLLQIRDNHNVRIEEHQSFANFSKIEPHQIEQFKKRQQLKRAIRNCPLELQQQVLTSFSV
mgnify:CR=1 FL=1